MTEETTANTEPCTVEAWRNPLPQELDGRKSLEVPEWLDSLAKAKCIIVDWSGMHRGWLIEIVHAGGQLGLYCRPGEWILRSHDGRLHTAKDEDHVDIFARLNAEATGEAHAPAEPTGA